MNIELADAIEAIREQLFEVYKKKSETGIIFRLDNIELDMEFQISEMKEGGGGIKFWVVDLGSKRNKSSTSTHHVKLRFSVRTTDGDQVHFDEGDYLDLEEEEYTEDEY